MTAPWYRVQRHDHVGPLQEAFDAEEVRFRVGLVEEVDDFQACDQGVVEDLVEDTGGVVIAFEVVRQRP